MSYRRRFFPLASSYISPTSSTSPLPLEQLLALKRNPSAALRQTLGGSVSCSSYYNRTYSEPVQCYTASFESYEPESVHVELFKKGYGYDLFLCNNLITSYARMNNLAGARQLFEEIAEKNAVSWTCLINGYTNTGLPEKACVLFHLMMLSGFVPSRFTFGSVLRACQDCGPDMLVFGSLVHALVIKSLYFLDSMVCNALISMYGACCLDSVSNARKVFDMMHTKNLISWNSIISVHSHRGNVIDAFQLFSDMQESRYEFLEPNEYTFGSLITATFSCSPSSCGSNLLKQIYTRVSKCGFLSDLYVGSALVSAFARFGLVDKAKEIYNSMSHRNAVSMNGLMVGLIKRNMGEQAINIFRNRELVIVNSDSFVIILSALAESKSLEEGITRAKELHGSVIRNGLVDSKIVINNALINTYAKCGAIEEANRVFEYMRVKDQISWNTLISGLDQNGKFEEAIVSFCKMLSNGVLPSNYAVISSLSSCASLGLLRTGTQLHSNAIKMGLNMDISVSNSILSMYGECGDLSDCWKVFGSMHDYDHISWNSLIGALADSEASPTDSIGVLLNMMRSGWKPNRVTFIHILSALSPYSIIELNKQFHALVLKHGVSEDIMVKNALLSCYSKSGEISDCEHLFAEMSDIRDDVSWNCMVTGYIQNGNFTKAIDFVWFMMKDGQNMDHFTFASVVSACASIAALERGMETHAYGIRSCLESDVVVGSSLVDMYAKCGRIDYASRVFRAMPFRNEFSWNSMISGYARHGHGQKAIDLFKEMLRGDTQPNHVTFVGVLSACSHAGLVEQGLDFFESMSKNYGLTPKMEHYSCVVDLLGRSGKLDKLEDFIRRMPITPNMLIWRTVVVACSRTKDGRKTELGKHASRKLLELEPQNPANYVLTSNLYASKGIWDEVAKARSAMRSAIISKEAGCSWVTMRDGVHVFIAGDKSHPDMEKIYAKLHLINSKLRDAGYVPQLEFALYDLEVETKEELLSYHSEKLAVAFVLTRTSVGPIRIMKNLRVCGDCHSAFRYISKITERQIILRDSNRFHHFDDGNCSCGDYW